MQSQKLLLAIIIAHCSCSLARRVEQARNGMDVKNQSMSLRGLSSDGNYMALGSGTVARLTQSHRLTTRPPLYDHNHMLYACPQPGKEVVYLTLDDGPSNDLGELTDKMKDLGVKATFFWNGQNAPGSRTRFAKEGDDDHKRAIDMRKTELEGHSVAIHGISHKHMDDVKGQKNMEEHVIGGAEVLQDVLNTKGDNSAPNEHKLNLYRPPFGAWNKNANTFFRSKLASGFHVIRWDVDTNDWMSDGANTEWIANSAAGAVENNGAKDGHIVLMHETRNVVEEVTAVVKKIRSKCPNCEFWSIDQCFAAAGGSEFSDYASVASHADKNKKSAHPKPKSANTVPAQSALHQASAESPSSGKGFDVQWFDLKTGDSSPDPPGPGVQWFDLKTGDSLP